MKTIISSSFYSGLSGLLPGPKRLFPPPFENTSRLVYYASLYNSIEINSSFYKIPQARTVAKWAASVPDYFRFSFKLWKGISHSKGLKFNETDVVKFLKSVDPVRNKKGCLLIQFPSSIGEKYSVQFDKLLNCLKENDSCLWNIAVEFRNMSWYKESTYNLLKKFKVALVLHDMPKSATPRISHKSDFMYVRFHGPTGDYRGSYSEEFLSGYGTSVSAWLKEGKEVYLYFNNTMGDAFGNLNTINSLFDHNNMEREVKN